jgi:hypothetical protein
VAQGVQHAYEIFTVGIKETELSISLTAFPNPTMDNLTLQINDYNNEKLSYQLFDMQGKQLSSGQVTAQQTQIKMNSFSRDSAPKEEEVFPSKRISSPSVGIHK